MKHRIGGLDSPQPLPHERVTELMPGARLVIEPITPDVWHPFIQYKDATGAWNAVSLNTLCDGVQFERDDRFRAYASSRIVGINLDDMRNPRNIFALLHEIGHILVADAAGGKLNDEVADAWRLPVADRTVDDEELIYKNERSAWGAAFKLARKMRDERGVNLFKVFGSMDDCMGWIRAFSLRHYEKDMAKHVGRGALTRSDLVARWTVSTPREALYEDELEGLKELIEG